MNQKYFISQLEEINKLLNLLDSNEITAGEQAKIITRAKAAIIRIAGMNSPYYKDIEYNINGRGSYHNLSVAVVGSIRALQEDLENGYLKSVGDIIRSDIFSDYLDMAQHLLKEHYTDPAAVLIGSTLESHIRELCKTNEIETSIKKSDENIVPMKADTMNHELTKAGVYNSSYQKQITAWLSLRNSAAHGKHDEYNEAQIQLMLDGVRQFILSTS